ncbi:hypothetical protein J5Y09_06785 [Roseomonas sp. PWR1]|uniref:Uncharacterized protein n=1 Tax=Roseomonas nitratireducens TaxID=2820810 RepID=A0ABS4AQH1_9PROT|nr:hypothetical protein [Neoroseomonas nitratireducens]MBP0463609.1 hypothetical protein [Neoroseomonas nitratireducens]
MTADEARRALLQILEQQSGGTAPTEAAILVIQAVERAAAARTAVDAAMDAAANAIAVAAPGADAARIATLAAAWLREATGIAPDIGAAVARIAAASLPQPQEPPDWTSLPPAGRA